MIADGGTIIKINNKKSGNAGVILMNLDILRKNKFTDKCLEIHKKNKNKHDQWIINNYCKCNYVRLLPRFNIFLYQDDYLIEKNSGCNKMVCENCKVSFCWLCLVSPVDYPHFNSLGSNKCANKLWD